MKALAALVLSSVCLVAPAVASADSGSLTVTSNTYSGTPGYANVGLSVTVTKTTCDWTSTYCGWFPYVTETETSQPCSPSATRYVGKNVDGVGTYTQDLGTALLHGAAKRLCLYIYSNGDRLISEAVVTLNSAAPAPTPTPPPTENPSPPPPLTVRDAKASLPAILRREYRERFNRRKHFYRSCYRYSTEKVRCTVRWDSGSFRYRGAVSMRNDPDEADSILYWTNIHRKRLRPKYQPPPQQTCDPNYSGCLNPDASDYDCAGGSGDGPYYTGRVRVIGDDHYDLDRDGDGVACED